jgi:flagellar motor switch protein FliM
VELSNKKLGGLSDKRSSLGHKKVTVKAEYASVNVTVNELSSIKVGDVIRLDKNINQPMSVYNCSGDKLFEGYLGKSDKNLALVLTTNKS